VPRAPSRMDLDCAVASQIGHRPHESVEELVLDACKASKVTGLDKFTNLKMLTLNGCGLTTLDGFPTLPKLKTLELADNQLCDGLEALQDAGLLHLTRLNLAGNRISSLDSLEPLGSLPNLRDLDLYTCAVTDLPNYRDGIFQMLPNLKYLDGFDENDNEKDEDEDDEDEDGDEDDLLSSEVGEEDDDLGEDDEGFGEDDGEEAYGEDDDDDFGDEDEGEEDGGLENEDDEADGEDDPVATSAKRQRR